MTWDEAKQKGHVRRPEWEEGHYTDLSKGRPIIRSTDKPNTICGLVSHADAYADDWEECV